MGKFSNLFVEVKNGTKITYSESDLRKLDRTYEKEILENKEKRVSSPLRKDPPRAYLTRIRDYAFERILDSHMYTFKHILVIPNPYDIVKQSALLLFNSSKKTKVRYRVLGDTPDADFVGETQYTNRHRVPILGLYLERSNKVDLELIDEEGAVIKHRMIRIYVSETPKKIKDVLQYNMIKGTAKFPWIMTNGVAFNPIVLDCNGDIRYSIQLRTSKIGMIPLKHGKFLYEDRTATRMRENGELMACKYHEMDYMGRIYRTYLIEHPLERYAAQEGDSVFLISGSDAYHSADVILEMNMQSGEIMKSVDLRNLLGEKYRTTERWANISGLIVQEGQVILAMKRLHTLLAFDWEKSEVKWIIAPEKIWKGTELEQYVLSGDVPADEISYQPDDVSIVSSEAGQSGLHLLVFQDRNDGGIQLENMESKYSALSYLEIDLQKRNYQLLKNYECEKTKAFGRGFYSEDHSRMLLSSGMLNTIENDIKCKIKEVDTKTKEVIHELHFLKAVNRLWEFVPDMIEYGNPVTMAGEVVFGSLKGPEIFTGKLPEISDEKIARVYFGDAHLCEDIFFGAILPGRIARVYFIGAEHAYVQDYSNMLPKEVKFSFAISLKDFEKDEYVIYVESQGVVHRLKNDIRVGEHF